MENSNKITSLSDSELLLFYTQNGEAAYFGELYRRYIPKVYGLCLKYLAEKEIARDAVMDIYADLTEKVRNYEIANFNTWLYSVAKNHCLHILRKNERAIFVNFEDAFVENSSFFTLNNKSQNEDELSALDFCMGRLSAEQETGVRLFYLEEKSYADIVKMTGFELNKVKSYIQNGKRNLKICIDNRLKIK